MMNFLDFLEPNQKRNIALFILGIIAASQIIWLRETLNIVMLFKIGPIDAGTIIGLIGIFIVFQMWKRRV